MSNNPSLNPLNISKTDLINIIRNAPLVSIDLVVKNKQGEVLLGLRSNKPAMGTWFVPGGRIRKGEHIQDAFKRIIKNEIGAEVNFAAGRFLGVFEHFYDDNFAGMPGFGTHYVVLGYELHLPDEVKEFQSKQHHEFRWWKISDLLESELVHPNTKAFFS